MSVLKTTATSFAAMVGLILSGSGAALAQTAPNNQPPSAPSSAGNNLLSSNLMSEGEIIMGIAILIFGIAVLAAQFFQQRRSQDFSADSIMKTTIVTLIVIGTLLMITMGLSSQQIAPALGLFGTIAGYLLGKRDSVETPAARRPEN